jgi:glycine oxidase
VRGHADDGPFEVAATEVIIATGAWTEQGMGLPATTVGVRPVKGQLVRLAGPPLLDRVVRTPDVYLIPRRDGELLVGATMEEVGFSTEPTAGAVLDLLRHAWEVLPGVYDLELREVSVGLRSAVEDHLPVIGPTRTQGLWLAIGHYRNGILLAPGTAQHLVRWIVEGERPEALAPFDPGRLERREAGSPTEVLGG